MMRLPFVAVYLALTIPASLQAQWPQRFAVDAAIGEANGQGGEYSDRLRGVWRLGVRARVVNLAGMRVIAGVERERYFMEGDRVNICFIGSHGQCLTEFPQFSGWTAMGELQAPVVKRFALSAMVGLTRTRSTDGAVRFLPDDTSPGWFIGGEAALRLWRSLSLTAATRKTHLNAIRSDHLELHSTTVGLRGSLAPN